MIKLKGVEISSCDEDFLIQIYEILKQDKFFDSKILALRLAETFSSHGLISFVAHRKKKVLGFTLCLRDDVDIYIKFFYVANKYRGCGIASALLDCIFKNAKNFGAKNFFIDISTGYDDLIKFFKNKGFEAFGQKVILKKYMEKEIEDISKK